MFDLQDFSNISARYGTRFAAQGELKEQGKRREPGSRPWLLFSFLFSGMAYRVFEYLLIRKHFQSGSSYKMSGHGQTNFTAIDSRTGSSQFKPLRLVRKLRRRLPLRTAVFELRIYHTYEGKLDDLLSRFRDHTMRIFEKHGMKNIAYWTPTDDPLKGKTLIYVIAHASRDAATANWKAF